MANNDYQDVPVFDGQGYDNQQQNQTNLQPQAPQAPSAGASAEQTREMAEVQGAMLIARANPRDENQSYQKILKACQRKGLAETALYEYERGGNPIKGPSVRLAETAARLWGNITFGFREIGREGDKSEVVAFSWDLETNCRVTRQFSVKHYRDTRNGPVKLTQERDIYELVANYAQRRVRACLLELIPGDVVEDAVEACEHTVKQAAKREEYGEKILQAFQAFGVNRPMLNRWLGYDIGKIIPDDATRLKGVFQAIQDGEGMVSDYFDTSLQDQTTQGNKDTGSNQAGSDSDTGQPSGSGSGSRAAGPQPPPDDAPPEPEPDNETFGQDDDQGPFYQEGEPVHDPFQDDQPVQGPEPPPGPQEGHDNTAGSGQDDQGPTPQADSGLTIDDWETYASSAAKSKKNREKLETYVGIYADQKGIDLDLAKLEAMKYWDRFVKAFEKWKRGRGKENKPGSMPLTTVGAGDQGTPGQVEPGADPMGDGSKGYDSQNQSAGEGVSDSDTVECPSRSMAEMSVKFCRERCRDFKDCSVWNQ